MADTQQLADQLVALDDVEWFTVLEEAQAKRRAKAEAEASEDPGKDVGDADFAEWIGRKHLITDPSVKEVIYLPTGAPSREIRLVEISVLTVIPEEDPFVPFDYSVDIDGVAFNVQVVDLTPDQWDAVQRTPAKLPPGWQLSGHRRVGRKRLP